jgi:indolepyruvate ferredoxin oxidoreductase, alpha subunit
MTSEAPTISIFRPNTYSKPRLLSGDEAVATAALDSGIRFAASYPGTPASDVLETLIRHANPDRTRCVWSVNEKVAYESSLAVAISGQRSLVALKHVGVNVAADAFVTSCYCGVNAGLVMLVADDPGCHSSQNEQDSRHYQTLSGTLLLEPCDSQEAYSMTREAFKLSEQYRLPIIIRLTTRTAHGCTPVTVEPADCQSMHSIWPKEPDRFLAVPVVSRKLHRRLAELQFELEASVATSRFGRQQNSMAAQGSRIGIICSGIGASFAFEFAPPDTGILKIAGTPIPKDLVVNFLNEHDQVLVLEEGDPFIEERVRLIAAPSLKVLGRISGELSVTGELDPAEIQAAFDRSPTTALSVNQAAIDLPIRLPEICKGCGYHQVFEALSEMTEIETPSDIGCNTLGGLPPYKVMDSNLAMGSSIGMACGLASVGHKRIVAILGDSTFFHSGIPPLIEAVRQGLEFTVMLLDNGTTAMTGGQDVAHCLPQNSIQRRVDMDKLIHAIGVNSCTVFDPHEVGVSGIKCLIENSFNSRGINVLIYRSPCLLYSPGYGRVVKAG